MNESSIPLPAAGTQQLWLVVTLPAATTSAEVELLVAHLRAHVAATYFAEFTWGAVRIHAFVPQTPGQSPVDLKQKLGGLFVEATAGAKHADGDRRAPEPWSPA